jgi:hypothetical protein
MHRSGTSAATRVLNLMGLATCMPSDLIKSRGGNERGYWESGSLARFDDALLNKIGCAWWCPPGPTELAEALERQSEERVRGAKIFRTVHPAGPWVWKDPRLCLLSLWWRDTLHEDPVTVLTVRDPMESTRSLLKHSRFDLEWGLALWERYLRAALGALIGRPVFVWRYSDLLNYSDGITRQATAFLTHQGYPVLPGGEDAIAAFLDPRLRHQTHADDDGRPLTRAQRELELILDGLVGPHDALYPPALPDESASTGKLLAWHRKRFQLAHRARPLRHI